MKEIVSISRRAYTFAVMLALAIVLPAASFATDPTAITVPDLNLDFAGLGTALAVAIGAILAVMFGLKGTIQAARVAWRWIRGVA